VHVCKNTTRRCSKNKHEQHIDHSENEIEFNHFENRDVACRVTHAQGTGGSSPTHGELLDVADHSRCRKMYAVQSLEHPPGSRRSEEEEDDDVGSHQEEASSREDAPKNLIARTPEKMSQIQTAIPEACSPNSPCAQRIGTGKLRRQRSTEK